MNIIDKMTHEAIDALGAFPDDFDPPVTSEEIATLHELYRFQGFGGLENRMSNTVDAQTLARERLAWLREIRQGIYLETDDEHSDLASTKASATRVRNGSNR